MRVYVRVENVVDIKQPRGSTCHVKLQSSNVIMRTHSLPVSATGALNFIDPVTKQPNELFVFYAKSFDHLLSTRISIQLRRARLFLRSERVGEATIPFDKMNMERFMCLSLPLLNSDRVVVGKVVARVELDSGMPAPSHNVDPLKSLVESGEGKPCEIVANATPAATAVVTPLVEQVAVPSTQRSVAAASPPLSPRSEKVRSRTAGTQTDRLLFSRDDAKGLCDFPTEKRLSSSDGTAVITRFDPPPSNDVVTPRCSPNALRMPVGAQALQKVLPVFPTDAMEGLLMYCEHTTRYQREMERSLSEYHLDRARLRAKAMSNRSVSISSSELHQNVTRHEDATLDHSSQGVTDSSSHHVSLAEVLRQEKHDDLSMLMEQL